MASHGFAADAPTAQLNFVNDIVPILTKADCNTGGCHAKAITGQRGFRLSLLGFEPQEDYEHIVKEGRGRRIFPAAPDQSLLLLKAANIVPHGGGKKVDLPGNVAVVVRYSGKVAVSGIFIPLVAPVEVVPPSKITIEDFNGRPTPIVDHGKPIPELIA